jgi:hypothetical protein
VSIEDETRQSATDGWLARRKRTHAWISWIGGLGIGRIWGAFSPEPEPDSDPAGTEQISLATLQALPTLLDGSTLPNGVVELVIEDVEAMARQLLDIHEGHIALAHPGQCVPWASISGPPTAWALALGPERDAAALQLTGDVQLALRVLAALPQPD